MDQLLQRLTALETLGKVARDQNEEILTRLEQQNLLSQARDRSAAVHEERVANLIARVAELERGHAKLRENQDKQDGAAKTVSIIATIVAAAISGLWAIVSWLFSKGH